MLNSFLKDATGGTVVVNSKCQMGGTGTGGLTGMQNLKPVNEVGMVIQCVIVESDKPVPPMKQPSWH